MNDSATTGRLTMHWVPVTDARGRTRMESRWLVDEPVATLPTSRPAVTHAA